MVCLAPRFNPDFAPATSSEAPRLFLVREALPVDARYGHMAGHAGHELSPQESDADALDALEEEIVVLAAHIHAATHRLLTLIAEFDRRRGWEWGGHRSCAHWLSFRTGIDLGAAREKVRAARALESLPQTSACMARGELSFSQLRALTRVATEGNEGDLLELAKGCTTTQLERMIRAFRKGTPADEAEAERRRHQARTFSVFPDDDGMYLVRGRLTAEEGALLLRAIEAASDAIFREERWPAVVVKAAAAQGHLLETETEREAAQRRADALGLVAERALAAGFGPASVPLSGSRAERYQVVLHVEAETLRRPPAPDPWGFAEGETAREAPGSGDGPSDISPTLRPAVSRKAGQVRSAPPPPGALGSGESSSSCPEEAKGPREPPRETVEGVAGGTSRVGGPRSHLEDGTRVSAETSRRLCCDASVVRVRHAPDGSILDVGRRTRTIPPALRRALEVRDRGCRFPGCGSRFTDAHHIIHWAQGGETSLGNTALLCKYHHRLVHEGGWTIDWWGEGRPVFFDPRGGAHCDGRWKPPELGEHPVAALVARQRDRGVDPDPWTAGARWKAEADIPGPVYFRALEALEESPP